MRQAAVVLIFVGLWVAGTSAAGAQLPDVPLPDVEDPTEQVPDLPELPELPDVDPPPAPNPPPPPGGTGGGSGGGGSTSGGGSGGSSGSGSGGGSGGGGGDSGGSGSSGSGSGSGSGDGSGSGRSGTYVCPCASPATGNPVAGDYDKCPLDRASTGGSASEPDGSVLAADRDTGGRDGDAPAGGVLGEAETDSDASAAGEAAIGALPDDTSNGSGLLPVAILVLGLGLLALGLAVGAGRLVGLRRGGPSQD